MSLPLGPSEKGEIQKVESDLETLIKQAKAGKEDDGALFNIAQRLSKLANNPKIPESIKQKLLAALKELQGEQLGNINVSKLMEAKKDIDESLSG